MSFLRVEAEPGRVMLLASQDSVSASGVSEAVNWLLLCLVSTSWCKLAAQHPASRLRPPGSTGEARGERTPSFWRWRPAVALARAHAPLAGTEPDPCSETVVTVPVCEVV